MRGLGKRVGIFLSSYDEEDEYTLFGLSTNCAVDTQCDLIEVAGEYDCKRFVAGNKETNIRVSGLYNFNEPDAGGMDNLWLYVGDEVYFHIVDVETHVPIATGKGYISTYSINAPVDGYTTIDFSIKVNGKLFTSNKPY